MAKFPSREITISKHTSNKLLIFKELRDGWEVISSRPLIKNIVGLNVLINISSYLGALAPALIQIQLNAGSAVYGLLQSAAVIWRSTGRSNFRPIRKKKWGRFNIDWGVVTSGT